MDLYMWCLTPVSVILYLNYSMCSFYHVQQNSVDFKHILQFGDRVLLLYQQNRLFHFIFIQEGEFSFSLESVKKLWDILANGESTKPTNRLSVFSSVKVCENPLLPKEFQPLCQSKNAQVHFSRLGKQCTIEYDRIGDI